MNKNFSNSDFSSSIVEGVRDYCNLFGIENVAELNITTYQNFNVLNDLKFNSNSSSELTKINEIFVDFSILIDLNDNTINCFFIKKRDKINGFYSNSSNFTFFKNFLKTILSSSRYKDCKINILK